MNSCQDLNRNDLEKQVSWKFEFRIPHCTYHLEL